MATELRRVAAHYATPDLTEKLRDAASAAGLDMARIGPADLAPADEFHIGGRQATIDLLGPLDLGRGQRVLDVGSGPGGAARFLAQTYGCRISGVDLTPEYVELASDLAQRTGLTDLVDYHVADALRWR
jgi:SAM-dependent methyltransferase